MTWPISASSCSTTTSSSRTRITGHERDHKHHMFLFERAIVCCKEADAMWHPDDVPNSHQNGSLVDAPPSRCTSVLKGVIWMTHLTRTVPCSLGARICHLLSHAHTQRSFVLPMSIPLFSPETRRLPGLEVWWSADEHPGAFWTTQDCVTLYSLDQEQLNRWAEEMNARIGDQQRRKGQDTSSETRPRVAGVGQDGRESTATLSWYESSSRIVRFDVLAMDPMPNRS